VVISIPSCLASSSLHSNLHPQTNNSGLVITGSHSTSELVDPGTHLQPSTPVFPASVSSSQGLSPSPGGTLIPGALSGYYPQNPITRYFTVDHFTPILTGERKLKSLAPYFHLYLHLYPP
jgi:hypothetical protein